MKNNILSLAVIFIFAGLTLFFVTGRMLAQSFSFSLAGGTDVQNQPVEITSDSLIIDQEEGAAVFKGDVVVLQGSMRLTSDNVRIEYDEKQKEIEYIYVLGNVLMVLPDQAIKAGEAVYTLSTKRVVMRDHVIYTQGSTTVSGDELLADLEKNTATMSGNVRTLLTPQQGALK